MILELAAILRCIFSAGRFDSGLVYAVWSAAAVAYADSYMVWSSVLVTLVGYLVPVSLPLGIFFSTLLQVLAIGPEYLHIGNGVIACAAVLEAIALRRATAAFL